MSVKTNKMFSSCPLSVKSLAMPLSLMLIGQIPGSGFSHWHGIRIQRVSKYGANKMLCSN